MKRPRAIFRFSRFGCARIGEMLACRSGKEGPVDALEDTGLDQHSKSKHIHKHQKGYRVRVWLNGRDCVGPLRVTLERAQQDLARVHACRGWVTKKAKLLELLKAAGNGVVRRGGRKPVPCAGVPKVAAVVVASCGAGSVGGMVSKPLPYGWYSKRASKRPLKEMRAALRKRVLRTRM